MDDLNSSGSRDELGDLLESFRWTERLARRLVGDSALAADLQQDTWTRAVEHFGDAVPGREWLAGTLRSLAFRARRGRQRRRLHEGRGAREAESSSTDELIERSEAQQRVAAATVRLPKDLRVVLLLRFQEGLSLSAVAIELGCSKSAAGDRVQRALVALRKELARDGGGWRACCVLAMPFRAADFLPSVALPFAGVAMKKLIAVVAVLTLLAAAVQFALGLRVPDRGADPEPVHSEVIAALEASAEPALAEVVLEASPRSRAAAPTNSAAAAPDEPDFATGFVFRARAVDEKGRAVPDARLWIRSRHFHMEARASTDGDIALFLDAEELARTEGSGFYITVGAGPYLSLWGTYVRADGTGRIAPPRAGHEEDLGTVTLDPAGAIEGRALSSTGDPIANATIRCLQPDEENPEARRVYRGVEPEIRTDENGGFVAAHLLAGSVGLCIVHPDHEAEAPVSVFDVIRDQTLGPVELRASAAAIVTGRVVGPDREPLSGVYVNGTGNWSVTDSAETDEEGRFRIGLREGDPAPVVAHLPGWRQVQPGADEPQRGGEIEILMEPAAVKSKAAARTTHLTEVNKPAVRGRLLRNGE
ncbi:MAG: sigma-70 family RNA polymerase sigma factor, partial [Planctomycetota bacterium]